MVVMFIFIGVLLVAVVGLMLICINILEEKESFKKSNEELIEANYKLTNKKNGK